MVILLSQRFSSMLCLFIFFCTFSFVLNMIFTSTLKESCAEPVLGNVNSFPIELYWKIARNDCF